MSQSQYGQGPPMMGFPITGGPWLSAPPMQQPPPMFFGGGAVGDPQHLVRSHIGFSGATSSTATIPRDLSTLCLMIHPTAYAPAQPYHRHHQYHQPPYRQQPHFSGKPVHIAPAASCRSARSIANEHTGNQLGILIKQANNLRDADGLLSGGSDVYCSVRTGPIHSSWNSKVSTERRSSTIHDCQNPNFQLAFLYGINSSSNDITREELHVRLFDEDGFLNSDDFLGEVRVKVTALLQDANNQTCDYPLEGDKAKGTLTIMVGTKVGQALMEELQKEISLGEQSCFLSPLASMQSTVSRLGIWFADRFNLNMTPAYAVNMARLGVVWASEPARVDDVVSTFIAERSNEKGEWSGPFLENCVTFSRHLDVSSRLVSLGERLGSNNGNGSVERENFLGFQRLTSVCWPELRNIGFGYRQPSIGLGQPQEAHAFIRPLIVRLCGPDSYTELGGASWLEEQANDFFSGRRRIVVPTDLKIWTAKLQHRVMLGMCITDEEAQDFQVMQGRIIIAMAVPEPALPALESALNTKEALKDKGKWLDKYRTALRKKLPDETSKMNDKQLTLLSSVVMDALLFAGGVSIPTVLGYCLALPRSKWGQTNLPPNFSLDDTNTHAAYVLEIIRRFAPVAGLAFTERSAGKASSRRVFLDILAAQRDRSVWGEDADSFRLRPLADYHKFSVAFAEPATVNGKLGAPNSHSCPGKDFGLASVFAFLKAYARAARPYGGVAKLWETFSTDMDENTGLRSALQPSDVTVNCFTASSFVLQQQHEAISLHSQDETGLELVAGLDAAAIEKIKQNPHFKSRDNLLYKTNANTQLFMRLVQLVFAGGKPPASSEQVSRNLLPKQDFSDQTYKAPIAGIKFLMLDEDKPSNETANFVKMLGIAAISNLPFEDAEAKENLIYWPSRETAAADIDEGFRRYLPQYFREHDDLSSDEGTAALFTYGAGSPYLTGVSSSTHIQPLGCIMEANLEYLAKYETRGKWLSYGACAYFGEGEDGGKKLPKMIGIWVCHCKKLVCPGEEMWSHAKAVLRTSLCCSLTLRDHLSYTHWVVANGLGIAARTELAPDHILRRLLKQFYFGTADINVASKQILLPVNGLAHRLFGFSEQAWPTYFGDVLAEWRWRPFPETLNEKGLPEVFLRRWPYAVDGMRLWTCFQSYVKSVLEQFYSDTKAVKADPQVVRFWASFETQFDTPWRLPPLSLEALISLVTDLMFQVTAVHELVGAIVEYLLMPDGLIPKLAPNATQADVQSTTQSLITIALTGLRQPPLLSDWTHIFRGLQDSWGAIRHQKVIDLVRRFQVDLIVCAEEIDGLNERRNLQHGRKFVAFNPRILETSVSI